MIIVWILWAMAAIIAGTAIVITVADDISNSGIIKDEDSDRGDDK